MRQTKAGSEFHKFLHPINLYLYIYIILKNKFKVQKFDGNMWCTMVHTNNGSLKGTVFYMHYESTSQQASVFTPV